jgi:hypothetical protein
MIASARRFNVPSFLLALCVCASTLVGCGGGQGTSAVPSVSLRGTRDCQEALQQTRQANSAARRPSYVCDDANPGGFVRRPVTILSCTERPRP